MKPLADQLAEFDNIGVSRLSDHEAPCCFAARAIIAGRLTAAVDVAEALATIPALVSWTPVAWPQHWCDVVRDETTLIGDCGTHGFLASFVLSHYGVEHDRGRAVLDPPNTAIEHWRRTWLDAGVSDAWIGERLVYHEVLRVGTRWWDPSEACFFILGDRVVGGFVRAVRTEFGAWATLDSVDAPIG